MTVQMIANAQGLSGLQAGLDRMQQLGYSPRPIYQAIANYGEASTRLRFVKQVGPDGQPWTPSHRARQAGGKTLVESARLLRSISSTADRDGAEWGTNVKYAAIHQFGGVIKAKGRALRFQMSGGGFVTVKQVTIPARPFLGINDADGREFEALTVEVIDQAAQRRGGK